MSVSAIKVAAKSPAKAAIIFLHGLGDSGEGWSWFPQYLAQSGVIPKATLDSINFVFPNAPIMPVSVNNGYPMPSWFDIFELGNPNAKQDIEGFLKSCDILKALVHEQIKNEIPKEKIIIGGFSQGAALSLATASLLDVKIGGVIGLSGFCPVRSTIEEKAKQSVNFDTPVFQGHGTADPVINYEYGKLTSEFYKELGFKNYTFNTYPGLAHSADDKELFDIAQFIKNIL